MPVTYQSVVPIINLLEKLFCKPNQGGIQRSGSRTVCAIDTVTLVAAAMYDLSSSAEME